MNIFKVFASSKKGMQEEYMSAIIAWFLNPAMEHGLGSTILRKLIEKVHPNNALLNDVLDILNPRLRSNVESFTPVYCHLEYPVSHSSGTAYIDIVFRIGNLVLCIENKIWANSSTKSQLKNEYIGIRQDSSLKDCRIGMIFLVPAPSDPTLQLDQSIIDEYDCLLPGDLNANDFKKLVTWQPHSDHVSMVDILTKILEEEQTGLIDPITEYTSHTIKALISFVRSDFDGYQFESPSSSGGLNPHTDEQVRGVKLLQYTRGFVGVKDGVAGLIRMCKDDTAKKHEYQFTKEDMKGKRNWMTIDQFKGVLAWFDGTAGFAWDLEQPLPSDILRLIASREGDRVFIGIMGGENGLQKMEKDQIGLKRWSISSTRKTNQWIPGDVFQSILASKGL